MDQLFMVNNTPQRQVHGNMLSPNVLMNKLQPSSTGRAVWQAAEYTCRRV